ncbi:hypothetical protein L6452_00902 [Arctium lappa]|uniref:Uncharacterized protein n=1 Tax=Arctium lappa TaxID=4217 RepID=A0ACB9FFA7_ARCLA|nr:hypothetical protein L6452_00902 [Arctium lappa]
MRTTILLHIPKSPKPLLLEYHKMEFHLCFLAFFSIIMIAITVDARPNPTEYTMQDSFVRQGTTPLPMKKIHGHMLAKTTTHRKSFNEEFKPRPNILVYDNEVSPDANNKDFVKDFEPRPNLSVYDDSISLKGKKNI